MKKILTKIFWPILTLFEANDGPIHYKKSHRVALNIVGVLFLFLSLVSTIAASFIGGLAPLIPVIVFLCVGIIALVVGSLGSDGAVSKIWGTKK